MLLAQEYDASEDGVAFISTHRRRLFAPDTRARVVGYLATAPIVTPGYRTDGVWVWPERLAEHALQTGVAPQDQLYAHLRERSFLLPDVVSDAAVAQAAQALDGPAIADPAPDFDWIHLGGYLDQADPPDVLLRIRLREDGSVAESRYDPTGSSRNDARGFENGPAPGSTTGWDASHALRSQQTRPHTDRRQYVEISGPEAAALNDRLCERTHHALLERSRESFLDNGLRLARVFDGESPAGAPWFSPNRLRIPEPIRRARIATYLTGGRLVLRANGQLPDPTAPVAHRGLPLSYRTDLPLSYRTDGRWIWPESLAYYVRTRGVAPELDFLRHIEALGYTPPESVPSEVVPVAGALVKAGPAPRVTPPPVTYLAEPPGLLLRSWGREPGAADALRDDLRWGRPTDDLLARGENRPLREVSEEDAVTFIDTRWSAGLAEPPLD